MEVVKITIIKLNEKECHALKKLLGDMNDKEFEKFGIVGTDREIMREIWGSLDYPEEDE